MVNMEYLGNIYKGKTVLITGHTGFKGSWLAIWLHELGAKVIGYSQDPYTQKDNFVLSGIGEKIVDIRGDIRDKNKLLRTFMEYKPNIVFHLAAQPLVQLSYQQPYDTYEINVMGTLNVLEAIRECKETKIGIFITTDKCYENTEQIWGYRETDPLGGYDPYSSSKAATEIAINSWRSSFFHPTNYKNHGKAISSVRAGNVIGGGDWAKDRIIPDCIRSLEKNIPIKIRNPKSIRPWEHVLEPLSGYLLLGKKMHEDPTKYSGAWNFGPEQNSIINVWDIANRIVESFGQGNLIDVSHSENFHEAKTLNLDISKARFLLGWEPTLNIKETIEFTANWYKQYRNCNVYELCKEQIETFIEKRGTS
jgi:CDP-glucose 4,6-dehydratase